MKSSPETSSAQFSHKMRISTVLVPLDFSPLSFSALNASVAIARGFGATIHFTHVLESDHRLRDMGAVAALLEKPMTRRDIEKRINGVARIHGLKPGEYECHLRSGRAFAEICALAAEIDAELIVTTTHGYSGVKRVLLGSTAERLVQHAPCPVLVARPLKRRVSGGKSKAPDFSPKRIIAATDFSECAMLGEQWAVQLARRFNAELLLTHAVSVPYYQIGDEYTSVDLPELIARIRELANEDMAKCRERLGQQLGRTVKGAIESGTPWEEITELARRKRGDLIVIATHGWTGLRHVLVGSTAERVVRHAPCAVLAVPSYPRKFAK